MSGAMEVSSIGAARLDLARGDAPQQSFIDEMAARYPTEPVLDHLLQRRMQRRNEPSLPSPGLKEMERSLADLLADTLEGEFAISDCRWLTGGASKMQMGLKLEWSEQGEPRSRDLVVRMEPTESLNPSSRVREFELLRVLADVVPVPTAWWVDAESRWFPDTAMVYDLVPGVAKPRHSTTGGVTGLGTNFGERLRGILGPQFVEHLGLIHTCAYQPADLPSFAQPQLGTTDAALWQLNRALRIWEEDRGEDVPIMEVAASWLRRNLPSLDRASIVHGDYRSGNFLFDEESGDITAWLDWERAHLGDRHRDLAWCTQSVFGHYSPDRQRYFASGLVDRELFYDQYEKASGLPVIEETLRFYQVLNCFQIAVATLATAYRVVRLAKSHQDVVVSRTAALAPVMIRELRLLLEECF